MVVGQGGGSRRGRRSSQFTRRDFLKAGAATGFAGAIGSGLSSSHGRLIDAALKAGAGGGSLGDIKHVVVLMQENRSFDHYFGTMQGVRGYTDKTPYQSYKGGPTTDPGSVFNQTMVGTAIGGSKVSYALADKETELWPFELISNPPSVSGQTTNDITHDWGPQHGAWNNGALDRWVVEHLANDGTADFQIGDDDGLPVPGESTAPIGVLTMGYYRQKDTLAFYRALADAFTICDGYHCSVLGPTDPNRVMWMSGSLGAHSKDVGGPILTTYVEGRQDVLGTFEWPTIPEVLTDNGVSWKVYQDPTSMALFNDLALFKNFLHPATTTQVANAAQGLTPVYPAEFQADVVAGTLPQVSWIMPPAACCEHPATPPEYGEFLVSEILQTLLLNPEVWAQTVFIVVYDENGGWFDHVSPPTPGGLVQHVSDLPSAAFAGGDLDGEYVTGSPDNGDGAPPTDWANVLGPVGLGFRVPAMIISPFSTGGWVCPDTFDHISTLKFIEKVFLPSGTLMGGDGLHISPWRYGTVGDLTTALPNLARPVSTVPPLPATSLLYPETATEALLNAIGTDDVGPAYPPPASNTDDYLSQDSEPSGFTRKRTPR
jgi:phospholipase C